MNTAEKPSFGALLRRLRKAAGLTQEELAELAELSVRELAYLERGRHAARPGTARRLADALALSGEDRASFLEDSERTAAVAVADVRTFLIADVRGYTRFTVEHGDEAAARLASAFAQLAREAASTHGGKVIETRGDEVLAVFASSRQALRAAIALQFRCVAAEQADPSLPLRVGIGIDAGEAVSVEDGYRGAALNLAARLCSLAGPRQVLASEGVVHLARRTEGLVYAERGVVELKGFVEPIRVVEVLSEDEMPELPVSGPGEEPIPPVVMSLPIGNFLGALPSGQLVGRDDELTRMLPALEAVESGSGQMLVLVGEAGIGKTRLAQEISLLARDRGFLLATGRCHEVERGVPLSPFLEALSMAYDAAPPAVRAQAARRWPQLGRLLPDRIGAPLRGDIDEQEEHQGLFRSVTGFLTGLAQQQPVALLLDDLHLADEGSLRLLQHVARNTRGQRILTLITYREGAVARDEPLDRVLRDLNHERLLERVTLARLAAEGTAAMVAATVGDMEAAEDFAGFVHRRSKGNPAVIDEMLRALGGRYRLVRLIGAGGMGRVFQAVDIRSGKIVAAKILFASSEADLDALLRFQQEGAVLSTLHHPNIVEVYSTFLEERTSCIIMELLEGRSLGQMLREERLDLGRIKHLARQAASALAYAHGKSIVHRDVKPDNIMVIANDRVKVTDFGIARILRPGSTLNTMTGMTLGTPLYMAPEQISGGRPDARADVYSLGAVLYEAVSGRPPFEGDDPITVAFRHVHEPPAPPRGIDSRVPPDWDALILKALAKDPTDRFQSAAEMERAIAGLGEPDEEVDHLRALPAETVESEAVPRPEKAARRASERFVEPVREVHAPAAVKRRARPLLAVGKGTRLAAALSVILIAATVALVVRLASPSGTTAPAPVLGHIATGWRIHTSTLQFNFPVSVAVGPGVIYVADTDNNRIARLTPTGLPLAPWGSAGSGPGQFTHPGAVAVDALGNVYVADTLNNRIQKFSPVGAPMAQWGSPVSQPSGIAIDRRGNVYVVGSNRIARLSPSGSLVKDWSPPGAVSGQNDVGGVAVDRHDRVYVTDPAADYIDVFSISGRLLHRFGSPGLGIGQLNQPAQLTVDSHGDVFVADSTNSRIQRFAPNGRATVLGSGRFSTPRGVALDAAGGIYVADAVGNQLVKLTSQGRFVVSWTGALAGEILADPTGAAIGPNGDLYVADAGHNRILAISPTGALLGAWGTAGVGPGQFSSPHGVAVDRSGNLYVADTFNDRVQKLTPQGRTVVVWRRVGANPFGLALDHSGDVYIADSTAGQIVEVGPSGHLIHQWGQGELSDPRGVAIDDRGRVYVADKGNNRIAIFDSSGRFLGQLGSGGSGAGGTEPGRFSGPEGVAVDRWGSVYVADTDNGRIQELAANGHVQAMIGGGRFVAPEGVAVSAAGNVYVADGGKNRVQEIVPRP
jgi:DNA-binding beta-propeller fold protein YncE/class 3 adenylate cyclase